MSNPIVHSAQLSQDCEDAEDGCLMVETDCCGVSRPGCETSTSDPAVYGDTITTCSPGSGCQS